MNKIYYLLTVIPIIINYSCQAQEPTKSYQDIRHGPVVLQSEWYSCGPAVIATLLQGFFGLDITEQTVIAIIDKLHQSSTNTSITLLDLKNVLINLSIESKGYQLSIDDIRRYFRTGGFPIIIHETYPKNHYALCIGIIDDYAILADPSIGLLSFSLQALVFDKGYDYKALVIFPNKDIQTLVKRRQTSILSTYQTRIEKMYLIRESFR